MINLGIRARVLVAAMLPVIVVALLLAIVFIVVVVNDLDATHRQRSLALARQIAATSEFALFTGNRPALEALLNASKREEDVRSLGVLDRNGSVVVQAGDLPAIHLPERAGQTYETADERRRIVIQPIVASELPVETLFDQGRAAASRPPEVLGYIALEVSRERLLESELVLVTAGIGLTLMGLLFGCLVALKLARTVSGPILQVVDVVDRFGQGELSARVPVDTSGSLRALQEGINRMADRIEQHRDELERRVDDATRELRVKAEEAEQANAAKSRFLAVASHDLRQPIHALRLFVDSLQEEVSGQPRAAALVARVQSSLDATSAMFDALLDISRLEAGVIEKDVHVFRIERVLRRIEMIFTPVAIERGLKFTVVPSRACVRSDPALLDRLLQNLVSNAMKYTASGSVLVGCRRKGERIVVQVWDTGPGIAPEHREDIFQEFFQLDNPGRDSGKGLGLGLAIVQRIARLLDHHVTLDSMPGRGSMFAVEVPRGDPGEVRSDEVRPTLVEHRFPGLRVGVVDDELPIREAMGEMLGRWGCTVVAAESGRELLAQLARTDSTIDFLICDYRLAHGASGLDTVEDVRQALRRNLPALLVTGDTAADRLREAHQSGYTLLHKPVAPAELRRVMYRLLVEARERGAT
ncbi:MAG: ATP-binding protein [Rhodospirillaceae bacterium]